MRGGADREVTQSERVELEHDTIRRSPARRRPLDLGPDDLGDKLKRSIGQREAGLRKSEWPEPRNADEQCASAIVTLGVSARKLRMPQNPSSTSATDRVKQGLLCPPSQWFRFASVASFVTHRAGPQGVHCDRDRSGSQVMNVGPSRRDALRLLCDLSSQRSRPHPHAWLIPATIAIRLTDEAHNQHDDQSTTDMRTR
jgi:hypothetical protein